MKRGNPIKPNELQEIVKKKKKIPEFIFDIFNELIQEAALHPYANKTFNILQKDICQKINEEHGSKDWPIWWLDIEEDYRNEGWDVKYDKPAYCENYDACFYFKEKLIS